MYNYEGTENIAVRPSQPDPSASSAAAATGALDRVWEVRCPSVPARSRGSQY